MKVIQGIYPPISFNPRPRRGAGATSIGPHVTPALSNVSILARAEARALQSAYNAMTINVEK